MTTKALSAACLITVLLMTCGCTSVRTTEISPDQQRDQFTSDELGRTGERVTITTTDGVSHEIRITQITADTVLGEETVDVEGVVDESTLEVGRTTATENVEIAIADIASVENREVTPVGAAGAIAGLGVFVYVVYFLLPALIVGAIVGM